MKVMDRLALIDKISRELQSRYGYTDINILLGAYKIAEPKDVTVNSKRIYSAHALKDVDTDKLLTIAEELGISGPHAGGAGTTGPKNWQGTTDFRVFISHISKDKVKAKRLKDCLAPHAINGFVAHEDIHPTLVWQTEIERALHTMDAFIAIHTPGFSASVWTQQEIGFAVGRGTKIISFKMGEDPTGFISKQQALARGTRTAEQIAAEIEALLHADEQTAKKLHDAQQAAAARRFVGMDEEVPF